MIESGRLPAELARPLRPVLIAVAAAVVAGIVVGVALHRLRSAPSGAPALPELHGQAVWPAGERPAPAFALRDQHAAVISSGALRGRPVLLTFLSIDCGACAPEARRLASVLRRLPAVQRPTLVIVSLDPRRDAPEAIDQVMRRWGLGGVWRWHWLSGSRVSLGAVWRAYGVAAGSAHRLRVFLIDRRGDERTAYLFPFLPTFVQGDLARLATEHA